MKIYPITYQQTKEMILNIHYARRMPSISYAFGLFDENMKMVGLVTYGKPASNNLCIGVCGAENSKNVYELNRLVITTNEKNMASYLVGNSLKMLPKHLIIVSYADEGWGHKGYVYQSTNWIYTGCTKQRTDIKSLSGGHSRHYDKGIDYKSERTLRSAKHRYIYFTNKRLKLYLKYPILPYPKGDSLRYDVNNPIKVR